MSARVELWRFPVSHYCDYAEFVLRLKGIPYDVVRRSPASYKDARRHTGRDEWPFLLTPDGPVRWDEVASWAEKTRPDPPLDPGEDGRRLERYVLISVGNAARRLFYRGATRDWGAVGRAYRGAAWKRLLYRRAFLPLVSRRYGATEWHEAEDLAHLDAVFRGETPVPLPVAGGPLLGGRRTTLDAAVAAMLGPVLVVPEWERRWGASPLWTWAVAEQKALRALRRT